LNLTPKPGLVDQINNGSHHDLTFEKMECSINLLGTYFQELNHHLDEGTSLSELKAIGQRAESRMMIHCGTNTHKGYIFLSGLFLIAAQTAPDLRVGISETAADLMNNTLEFTNGNRVRNIYNTGGIVDECLNGLPAVFEIALPLFQKKLVETQNFNTASFYMMAALMCHAEDTTAYHRCGANGIHQLKSDGRQLKHLLSAGIDIVPWLNERNHLYQVMELTMGGVADLMALTFAVNEMIKN